MLAGPDDALFDSTLEAAAWRAIGFAVVGVWFAVRGPIDELTKLFRHWQIGRMRDEYGGSGDNPELWLEAVESLLTLATGIGLLLGARALSSLLGKLRGREALARSTQAEAEAPDHRP